MDLGSLGCSYCHNMEYLCVCVCIYVSVCVRMYMHVVATGHSRDLS